MKSFILSLSLVALMLPSCKSNRYADYSDGLYAELQTNKGAIILKLEQEQTPLTVANFVSLAEGTSPFVSDQFKEKPFYDGLTFHRVMKDFMIQGGDPEASGRGYPGYRFKNEIRDSLRHDRKGILSMANSGGSATNGSQFFITHAPTPWLDGRHTVFGEVIEGMDVVDSIAAVDVDAQSNKPVVDVVMNKVEIIRKGKEAKQFDAVQIMEDYFAEETAAQDKIKAFGASLVEERQVADSLPSGLKYRIIRQGEGPKPTIGDMVLVDYAGWLDDGTLFDTSNDSIATAFGKLDELAQMHQGVFQPVPMKYSQDSQLIAGFKEALLQMQVGDKWRVYIPPYLGFGPQGGGPIPPNSNTVFDIEITGIQ